MITWLAIIYLWANLKWQWVAIDLDSTLISTLLIAIIDLLYSIRKSIENKNK